MICPKYAEGASHTARGKPLRSSFKSHSHKRLTFAFVLEIGYTLVLTHKNAHSGSQGQTGRASDGGCYHYSRRVLRTPKPLRAAVRRAYFAWGEGTVERSREPSEQRRAWYASLFRGVAAPQGCAAPLLAFVLHRRTVRLVIAASKSREKNLLLGLLTFCCGAGDSSLVTAVRFWNRCLRRSTRETCLSE